MNRWTVCLIAVFGALSPPSVFAQEGKVTVFAAASMKDALDEINAMFTKSTGIKVDASYAGSQTLVQLIEEGSRADVFLSADTNWMEGTSKNRPCSSDATKLPANDSVSFPFRFINVHSEAVSDRQRKRFFEVLLSQQNFLRRDAMPIYISR